MSKPSVSLVKDWSIVYDSDLVELAVGTAVFDEDYWRMTNKETRKVKYFYGEMAWADSQREASDLEWSITIHSNTELKRCPNCAGHIPNNKTPGAYPGAISRRDNKTEICSACGTMEALEDFMAREKVGA